MGKLDRLFLILNLLRSRSALSASDLAGKCEVSERTIYRDIHTLSRARVPIHFDGGYKIVTDEAFLPPLNFSVDEFLSLYVGLSSCSVQSVKCFREPARRALAKLESLIPEKVKSDYEKAKTHVVFQPERDCPNRGADLMFELLKQAIWPEQKIRLHCVSPHSCDVVEIAPKSLLYKRGKWHLVGLAQNEIRYFRLDHIKSISLPS
ncbi:MAG: HTH domain-containing protein, partial [Candidatus Zixiibacteriota bacterium]